jgi:hypothetical protein
MYVIILHSEYQENCMRKDTKEADKERLKETVDALTEENQRYFLGVLEALAFSQSERGKDGVKKEEKPPVYPV